MIVVNGNIMSRKPHEWAGDRPTIKVVHYPKMLRFIASQLNKKGCWQAEALEDVARDWGRMDAAINIVRLKDILAHSDLLTEAQISRINAAVEQLQKRSDSNV